MNKNDIRRKLLKSIAAGSGAVVAGKSLPESWSKPVIDPVMLPAHAATTDVTGSAGQGAPTPPPCCLVDNLYCDRAELSIDVDDSVYVEIGVKADGSVKGFVTHFDGQWGGSTKIACTGGGFNIVLDYVEDSGSGQLAAAALDTIQGPNVVSITGTVNCGQTSILGYVMLDQTRYDYTATTDCKPV